MYRIKFPADDYYCLVPKRTYLPLPYFLGNVIDYTIARVLKESRAYRVNVAWYIYMQPQLVPYLSHTI